jgi:CheY-like chemotaxis protein
MHNKIMNKNFTVLVIDDEKPLEDIYTNFLAKIGAQVTFCDHPQKGWQAIDKEKFDLIITDLRMPAITGDEFIKIVRDSKLNAHTPIILCSSFINKLVLTEMSRESKVYFLNKPFDSKALFELVAKATDLKEMTSVENTAQNEVWLNSFTAQLTTVLGQPAKVEKINSFDLWNFESISLTIFIQEASGPLSVNLLMKTKTFFKIAGNIQGTQYKEIEAENLSVWQQFLKGINQGTMKMTCSNVLSQKILLMPGQVPAFYKVTSAHEEILIYLN